MGKSQTGLKGKVKTGLIRWLQFHNEVSSTRGSGRVGQEMVDDADLAGASKDRK